MNSRNKSVPKLVKKDSGKIIAQLQAQRMQSAKNAKWRRVWILPCISFGFLMTVILHPSNLKKTSKSISNWWNTESKSTKAALKKAQYAEKDEQANKLIQELWALGMILDQPCEDDPETCHKQHEQLTVHVMDELNRLDERVEEKIQKENLKFLNFKRPSKSN